MKLSKEEFLKMQEEREVKRTNTQSYQQNRPRVSYFGLKDDGDEAVVRFACDPEEFEVYTVHPITVDGKFRKVNCINDLSVGVHSCPLCEAGVQLQNKFYIRLIEYTRDDQGNIVPEAKIWERPTSYIQRLVNLYTEYGSLKDVIFKVKRNGARGDMKTDYSMMFCNPSIYNDQLYVKDFSAFNEYTPLGTAIMNLDANAMHELMKTTGLEKSSVGEVFTPSTPSYIPPKVGVEGPAPQQQFSTVLTQNNNQGEQQFEAPRRSPVMY